MATYLITKVTDCPYCDGAGFFLKHPKEPALNSTGEDEFDCPHCKGTGEQVEQTPLQEALKALGILVPCRNHIKHEH